MRRTAIALLAALALLGAALAVPAQGKEKLPVSYNFLLGAVADAYPFDADPPGANDFSCKPSKRHPRPVVLVHGTAGNKNTNWRTYAPLLKNHGYCVFALTYGVPDGALPIQDQLGGFNDIKQSARQLKRFVAKVRAATGARKVDLIGHSQGTFMPAYWVKYLGGAQHVRNYISLAPLWKGTELASPLTQLGAVFGFDTGNLPICRACGQMAAGSAFLKKVRKGGVAVKGIRYTNIMTKYDQLVIPYTSGRAKGMRNIVVQDRCDLDLSEHFEIASDPVAAGIVLNTLDRTRTKKPPCLPVLPFVGPAGPVKGL